MFGGVFFGFGGQLFGNWRFRAKRRFRARVDPLAFSRFWAFLENFEGGGELEPPVSPLLWISRWYTFPDDTSSTCREIFGHGDSKQLMAIRHNESIVYRGELMAPTLSRPES